MALAVCVDQAKPYKSSTKDEQRNSLWFGLACRERKRMHRSESGNLIATRTFWGLNLPQPQTDEFVQAETEAAHAWDTFPLNDSAEIVLDSEPEADTEPKSAAVTHLLQQKELQQPENVGDRRQYRRYAVEGSAEMYRKGSQTRTWGPLTDISASGCYVEMYVPYGAGTELQMAIEVADAKIVAEGIVRVVYPGLGIGVEFTNIAEEDKIRLNDLLAPTSAAARSSPSR